MTNLDTSQLTGWIGRTAVDTEGQKIGEITDIYQDEDTGRPEWLTVSTGLFGTRASFVPLEGATAEGDDVQVRFTKDRVKDAPNVDSDGRISPEEETRLYEHYGVTSGTRTDAGRTGHEEGRSGTTGDDAMTRSEEELDVSTRQREAGRVRLNKWVETEHVERTVPVTHEEVRVEREPVTDADRDAAHSGPEISEGEHEVVLHDEEVVTDTHVEAKERINLTKEEVTEQERVAADLRKEQVEVEDDRSAQRR